MTTDYLTACLDACDLARKTIVAYVYKLRTGHYYISSSPPGSFSADYIAKAEASIPGGEPRIIGEEAK
jgi:hypothetical protein